MSQKNCASISIEKKKKNSRAWLALAINQILRAIILDSTSINRGEGAIYIYSQRFVSLCGNKKKRAPTINEQLIGAFLSFFNPPLPIVYCAFLSIYRLYTTFLFRCCFYQKVNFVLIDFIFFCLFVFCHTGENPAAMQHGRSASLRAAFLVTATATLLAFLR